MASSGSEIRRAHDHSFTNFLEAFDHHALAGVQAILDDPEIAAPLADPHRLDVDFVVCVHHGNLVAALQFRHRALRHQQGVVFQIELHPHARKFAGTKRVARIGEERLQPERPGGWANLPVRRVDSGL